jgi:ABC-type transport system involved in multi-copper enzyme maturation permease subunit
MLRHLIIKEIQEIVTNARSLFVMLICVVLIPLGLYVSTKEYEQAKTAYIDAERMYIEGNKDNRGMQFIAEGYIPPSPLSIFSSGLSGYLPNKISTNSQGVWQAINDHGINNPIALLFGKIDFYFIVTFILSLLAFIFTFNSITGEKESGTLRLIAANPVHRWKIIFAKIVGNYTVFLVSFFAGIISGLVLLTLTTNVPILSTSYLLPFVMILIISLMFLFILFNLGILLSIKTKNSGASITASLLLWVLIAVIIPKISPMIAQIVYPIETEEVVNKKKTMKREEIQEEYDKERGALLSAIMKENGLNAETFNIFSSWDDPAFTTSRNKYDKKISDIKNKYEIRKVEEIEKIERNYNSKKHVQQNIAKNISRISPVSSFTFLINDITHTGLGELKNIETNGNQFRQYTESEYYSRIRTDYKEYRVGGMISNGYFGDISKLGLEVPRLQNYIYPSLVDSLVNNWTDILLLCFYSLLFFIVSVFQFIKYDVR